MRLKVSNVCQLLDKSKYPETQTKQGITYTNDGNGIITINGTNTASDLCVFILNVMDGKPGHKYMQLGATDDGKWNTYGLECKWVDGDDVGHGFTMTNGIMSIPSDVIVRDIYVSALVYQGYTASNKTFKPQLFDLTEMYGVGNEPTTVAQFRQDFPDEMYDYSPVCWKKFRRLKYVTETKNLFKFSDTVGTLSGGLGPNVARNFEEDKWYIGFTPNNYYIPNNIEKFSIKDNLIYLKRKANTSGYGVARAFRCEPNKTYTVSCGAVFTEVPNCIFTSYFDKDGNLLSYNNVVIATKTITTPANCSWLILIFTSYNNTNPSLPCETYIINPQLELGSTATPYQPYGYLPLNRGKYIANKEPVQLLDKSKFKATSTDHGVTFTNNEDGTITVNGTNNGEIYYTLEVITSIPVGHKVIIDDSNSTLYFFGDMRDNNSVLLGTIPPRTIFTLLDNLARLSMLYFVSYSSSGVGHTYNNELSRPQLFDLTAMYGAGNEPTTVEQFRADYPNELYDYNPYNAITFR